MSLEINKLIKEYRYVNDDGRDYCAAIIDNWHVAARARSKTCYQPPVKPRRVCSPKAETGAMVKIGDRAIYGRKVVAGIYQLHLSSRSPVQIAHMLKMPVYRVQHLLKRGTKIRREIFRQVSTQPLPVEVEILRRLAAESRA